MKLRLEQAVEILRDTPRTLRARLEHASDDWVRGHYGPDTFSPFDVVGHLIHGERADWIPRARIILEHGEARPFEPFDRYAMYEASRGRTIGDLLDAFDALRRESLQALEAMRLDAEKLARRGMHPELGPVTLAQLIATWAGHDLHHIAQVCKAMAWQYREAYGPWIEYLGIVR
jgi:hypothetical protein